jgi:hypothetical protein
VRSPWQWVIEGISATSLANGRYMEKYPENTEIAFEEALRVGSHGLETGTLISRSCLTR